MLQREHAAKVLVRLRQARLKFEYPSQRLLGILEARLREQRPAKETQVFDGVRCQCETLAADGFGARRVARRKRLKRGSDARVAR